jgi:DNA-binding NtrC family response regulator
MMKSPYARDWQNTSPMITPRIMLFLSENHTVDIVLSDIKMPEIEGIELLEKIKSEHMDIKVIFITAFYTIESSISAMKKGAYNCLSKPIDFIKLETILKNAVTNRFC